MIVDKLANSYLYYGISEDIKKALKFFKDNNLKDLKPGEYEIDKSRVYAQVREYESKPIENGKWEAHKKYIDVQYIVSGVELIGYSNIESMSITQEYDETRDCMFLKGHGDFFTMTAGSFAIFNPTDVHIPGIAAEQPVKIKKVIVKVLIA